MRVQAMPRDMFLVNASCIVMESSADEPISEYQSDGDLSMRSISIRSEPVPEPVYVHIDKKEQE